MNHSVSAALLVLVLAGGPALQAQQAGSEDPVANLHDRLEQLESRLNLTPEQAEKLEPILRQEAFEMRDVRDRLGSNTTRHGRMTMMKELKGVQQKYEPGINEILTPEQRAEWKQMKLERKQQLRDEKQRQAGGE